MKILKQIIFYIAICIFGECVAAVLPFKFSASIISMTLLFLLLFFGIVKKSQIKETSEFLLGNLALFLIPASVIIIEYYKLLISIIVPLLVICTISTIITFAVTSFTVSATSNFLDRKNKKNG